jgi:hypothetical protein
MSTTMSLYVNDTDYSHDRATYPANFGLLDLVNDYLIWTAGDSIVKDLMTHEPTADELNTAATIISDTVDTMVTLCLWMDYSHDRGGAYYTHTVLGMGANSRYSYCFAFDNITATIPRLEAWDDSDHDSSAKHILGNGTPANSMVKAVRTTSGLPGAGWVGTAIAGASNYVELDTAVLSGAKDLYANLKIVIPIAYATPSAETFVWTVRYTYL